MKKYLLLFAFALGFAATGCAGNKSDAAPAATTAAEGVPSTVKQIDPQLRGTDIIAAIKKNYPNRVVLFDLWATWCPPCRAALQEIDAIKPQLQEKGVAFVYVTGETSPLPTWQQMTPSISGDHYRLPKAQWESLLTTYGVPGIPAYLILGKDGSTAWSNLSEGGYPGNDVVQNQLEVALTK